MMRLLPHLMITPDAPESFLPMGHIIYRARFVREYTLRLSTKLNHIRVFFLPDMSKPNKKVFVSGAAICSIRAMWLSSRRPLRYGDLYVGIGPTPQWPSLKHRRTVYSEKERLYMVKAIRYVTDAYINSGSGMLDFRYLDRVKPDIFVVNSDGGSDAKRRLCMPSAALSILNWKGCPTKAEASLDHLSAQA